MRDTHHPCADSDFLLNTEEPQIVITDIVMGNYSGLDFVQKLRENNQTAKVIVISGHEQFNYAKRAIDLGAIGYLLKPINQGKLIFEINQCLEQICKNNKQDSSNEKFVKYLLRYKFEPPKEALKAPNQFLSKLFENYTVVYINTHTANIKELFDTALDLCSGLHVSVSLNDNIVLIVTNIQIYLLMSIFQSIINHDSQKQTLIEVGFSQMESCIEQLYPAVLQAKANMKKLIFSEKDINEIIAKAEEDFYPAISQGNFNEIPKILYPIISFTPDNDSKKNTLRRFYKMTWEYLRPYARNKTPKVSGIDSDSYDDYLHLFLLLFDCLYKTENLSGYSKKCLTCDVACDLIDEDCANASLETIASKLKISPSYLSNIYKEINESNIKQYITNAKISKAEELLHNPEISIGDIFNLVGYSDEKYFKHIFKKQTGLTMVEFKKTAISKPKSPK